MESQYMRSYTIKEVSKMMNVPAGTLRQWEKDLTGLLMIPRTKQGARFYTEPEINLLQKIKQMRDKNLGKEMIRDLIKKHFEQVSVTRFEPAQTTLSIVPPAPKTTETLPTPQSRSLDDFLDAMEEYRVTLLRDVKHEIRNGIRKEVLDEVKREISKGSLQTVKNLSDSIYKSTENTKAEIKDLSLAVNKTAEQTNDTVRSLSHNITKASKGTSEKLSSLANQISNSSEQTSESVKTLAKNLAKTSKGTSDKVNALFKRISETSEASSEEFRTVIHYISNSTEVTNNEISSLVDTLNKDRAFYIETINKEREQLQTEIRNREEVFQDLVVSFRKTAAANDKEKKWWKFWNQSN